MKLNPKEFKRFKELSAKLKSKKISAAEEAELAELASKKNERGSNDLQWWKNYPELLKQVTNIAFNYIPGTSLDLDTPDSAHPTSQVHFAGVARVAYVPTIGRSVSASDAFNAQMRQLWLDMHRKYRGMGGYQRADLGMNVLAIEELFATLSKFERIYGTINNYKVMNRNVPYTFFEALQIDPSIQDSMADFRYGLNIRIEKMKQLCLPKGLASIEDKIIRNGFIFKDSENDRSSFFLFDPTVYGVYDATTIPTGGCVMFKTYAAKQTGRTPNNVQAFTLADIFDILDEQISALIEDDDVAKMCSDLIAAYGPENVATVGYVPEDYKVEPVHDYERKLQFHNLTMCGNVWGAYSTSVINAAAVSTVLLPNNIKNMVYQENDIIKCELTAASSFDAYIDATNGLTIHGTASTSAERGVSESTLLDTWVDNPGEQEIMCGTRLTALCERSATFTSSGGTTKIAQYIKTFGLAVPEYIEIFTRNGSSVTSETIYASVYNSSVYVVANTLHKFASLGKFDWSPLCYVYNLSGSLFELVVLGDVDNVTKLHGDDLARLHEVAIYSAYKIPNVSYIQ